MREYVRCCNIKNTQFTEEQPGYEWVKKFMERNKLTLKKAEMIRSSRIANTSNPFIIYDFYNTLERVKIYIFGKKSISEVSDQSAKCVQA